MLDQFFRQGETSSAVITQEGLVDLDQHRLPLADSFGMFCRGIQRLLEFGKRKGGVRLTVISQGELRIFCDGFPEFFPGLDVSADIKEVLAFLIMCQSSIRRCRYSDGTGWRLRYCRCRRFGACGAIFLFGTGGA